MALTADKKTEYKEGVEIPQPVAGGSRIFAGALTCTNAAGYLVPASDAAGLIFQGIARQHVDNTGGNNGDETCLVRRKPTLARMTLGHAITRANIGDNVFVVDDETVDLVSNVTYGILAGTIAEYIDATGAWVDIEPAILQADVATHISDTSSAHGASAISLADAGDHFSADEANVEAALSKLAKTVTITIPRFTGWTKDGAAHAIGAPALELPVPVRVKRAYAGLGTAPGADKTLALALNAESLLSIAGTDTQGEAEALDIAVAADTDIAITAAETAAGSGAACDVILVAQVDDGE